MVHELLARIDPLCLGWIRTARVGLRVEFGQLILWLDVKHAPPPNWLKALTIKLLHDDGVTRLVCRPIFVSTDGPEVELWISPVNDTRFWRQRFILPGELPRIPVSHVIVERKPRFSSPERSRRFQNLSSLKASKRQ